MTETQLTGLCHPTGEENAVKTSIQVLSEEERIRVHEASLNILENTGVRVETTQGRRILEEAGAVVDGTSKVVKFPQR